jgi:hypothetical protein
MTNATREENIVEEILNFESISLDTQKSLFEMLTL